MEREQGSSADVHGQGKTTEIELPVIGMYCANCAKAIERSLTRKTEGVESASANYASESVHVRYDPEQISLDQLAENVRNAGYRLVLPDPDDDPGNTEAIARRQEIRQQKRYLNVGLIFTVPLFLLSMGRGWGIVPEAIGSAFWYEILLLLLATPVQFYTGGGFYTGAFRALRNGTSNMDVLVALGSSAAYFYSIGVLITGGGHLYFETAAMIITLIKVGKWLEISAKGKASSAIESLLKRIPPTANLIDEHGEDQKISLNAIRPGDLVRVKPGETVPVDGVVESGETDIDASMLTGESTPIEVGVGDEVFGGTINVHGVINVQVLRPGSDSAVARIVKRVKAAQGSKAPIQRLVDRVASVFVPTIVAIAVLTLIGWWLGSGSFETALVRMVTVLVIACPCAMGLATPTAVMTGMGTGAKMGIIFRDSEALETGAKIKVVAFDKTGTLTSGQPELHTTQVLGKMRERELLEQAASALKNSNHPLAQATVRRAKTRNVQLLGTAMFEEEAGYGVRSMLDNGRLIRVGKPERFENVSDPILENIAKMRARGETVSLVADRMNILGALGFMDTPRDEAARAVKDVKALGMRTVMLSGDHQQIAETVAEEVGIKEIIAELTPEGKEDAVLKLRKTAGGSVAVIGDGINDAPALVRADLGIAIGSGSDVAIESAGITLPSNDLRGVARAMVLSRKTVEVIKQNLFWAFFYNAALVPVAAGVLVIIPTAPAGIQFLHPAFAAAAMAFSSITVILNSLRLGKVKL
jgi:P-type Cu+ transporter